MNYCTSCGKQLQGESKFCTKCGAEQSTQKLSMEKVQCEQCHSVNVQVQVKNAKNPIMLGCALILGGLGIWVLGLLGAIGGVLIGLLIGAITKGLMPTPRETVVVCQDCGHASKPIRQTELLRYEMKR